jgi:hypothetical protein
MTFSEELAIVTKEEFKHQIKSAKKVAKFFGYLTIICLVVGFGGGYLGVDTKGVLAFSWLFFLIWGWMKLTANASTKALERAERALKEAKKNYKGRAKEEN